MHYPIANKKLRSSIRFIENAAAQSEQLQKIKRVMNAFAKKNGLNASSNRWDSLYYEAVKEKPYVAKDPHWRYVSVSISMEVKGPTLTFSIDRAGPEARHTMDGPIEEEYEVYSKKIPITDDMKKFKGLLEPNFNAAMAIFDKECAQFKCTKVRP